MSFNFNNSSGPFVGGQGYRQNTGMFDAATAGAISLPEKVLGLTCLLVACAIAGVVLGYQGLNTATAAGVSGSYFLWFIVEIALLIGAQAMAARPGIGMVLFLAFGVSTGVIISPLIQILGSDGMQYVVYQALGATAAATGGATLYARTTRRDFSHWAFAKCVAIHHRNRAEVASAGTAASCKQNSIGMIAPMKKILAGMGDICQ